MISNKTETAIRDAFPAHQADAILSALSEIERRDTEPTANGSGRPHWIGDSKATLHEFWRRACTEFEHTTVGHWLIVEAMLKEIENG